MHGAAGRKPAAAAAAFLHVAASAARGRISNLRRILQVNQPAPGEDRAPQCRAPCACVAILGFAALAAGDRILFEDDLGKNQVWRFSLIGSRDAKRAAASRAPYATLGFAGTAGTAHGVIALKVREIADAC